MIARQFLFDVWHYFLLKELCSSPDERLAAIAEKSIKEVTYHVRRSSDILIRLGDGTAESHAKMQESINDAWRFVGELFLDDEIVQALAERKVVPTHTQLWPAWLEHVSSTLEEATLALPSPDDAHHRAHQGGITGRHTEALGYILAEMQHLHRTYPGAAW